jgi:hypothetical protein
MGDGAIVRAGLDALLDLLGQFAAPTGARGSILLMTGGLIVLGFLFLAFLFRSAIVGDLAPVANARAPTPRIHLPPPPMRATGATGALPPHPFEAGRAAGQKATGTVDDAMALARGLGADARILQSNAHFKCIRVYRCPTCQHGAQAAGCEYERGLFAGAFGSVSGELAKVHESACVGRGAPFCEFEVGHAALMEAT